MSVSGQSCSSSDCSTCLSDSSCYYFVSCKSCISYSSGTCNGESSAHYASMCPTLPTAPTVTEAVRPFSSAYWLLSLGAVAVIVTAVIVYTDIEKLCSQKIPTDSQGSSSPPASPGGFGCSVHMLFLSCICLWFGLSLDLASPALPWLLSLSATSSSSANAFFVQYCLLDSAGSKAPTICYQYTLVQFLTFQGSSITDLAYAQNALSFGSVAYVFSIGLFFPCALMTSIAVYRLNKKIKYVITPYTSGCSLGSLLVAQILGWTSLFVYSVVIFCATSMCAELATKYPLYNAGPYTLLPGSVAAGIGMALQLVGLILQAIAARALISVPGIGCNRGGCCKISIGNTPPWQPNPINTLNDGGPVKEQFKVLSVAPTY